MTGDTPVAEQPADASAEQADAPKVARLDRLNKWLMLAANVGVIGGLLLVFVEVRQNAELTRTQMEQRKNDFLAEIEFSLAQPEIAAVWVKAVKTPEALTDAEIKTVDSHLISMMLQWDHMFQMERSGLVTRDHVRQHIENSAPYYFGSRFGQNWWRLQMPGWGGTPMEEVAGPIVEALDPNFIASSWEKMRIAPPVMAAPAAVTP